MLGDYFPFLVYAFFAAVIPASMIAFSFLFATAPQRRVKARFLPFESGVSEGAPKRQRFTVSFYLTAMLFILFDIEIVFLYPLAIVLELRDLLLEDPRPPGRPEQPLALETGLRERPLRHAAPVDGLV